MTYEEQLQIEKLNKETIKYITENVNRDDFINYYINHNRKETREFYNIRTDKVLIKILTIFGYDFSKPKPSKFKGKKSVRSHESYINGGKKSAETQQQHWEEKSDEEKQAWSDKQKEAHSTEQFRTAIKQINIDYWASLSEEQKAAILAKRSASNKKAWELAHDDILQKAYNTRKARHTFNSSQPEENYFEILKEKYGKDNVIRRYSTDSRYPYECDFYIKSEDLFIELNLHWTHGGKPFDANSAADKAKLNKWIEKSVESKQYEKAVWVWTIHDPEKQAVAIKNGLNYIMYYTEDELYGQE